MAVASRKEQIEAMLAEEPNDPELHYMLAMEYVSSGEDGRAADIFLDLIKRFPDYPPGSHQGARTLVRLGRIDEARKALGQGIAAALKQKNDHAAAEMQELLESLT
jgi:thioredoxin-like negative regulator of GroEL